MHRDVPNDLQAGSVLYSNFSVTREGCTLDTRWSEGPRINNTNYSRIFLVLMTDHLWRLTYSEIAVKAENKMTAFRPAFLRSSCSGSAAQFKNVTTSLAIWEVVAGVPGTNTVSKCVL